MNLLSIDPSTGEQFDAFEEMSAAEVDAALAQAAACFAEWRRTSFAERAKPMREAARLLRERKTAYGELMAREMGKPIAAGEAEAEKCAWVCEYFAEHAETFLQPEIIESDATKSFVSYQPIGVMLAIMPWNFPFWQVLRCAAPGIMAGNTFVLKHANNVTGSALAVEQLLRDAGFPEGILTALRIDIPRIEGVIRDDRVQHVSLTGSTRAGRAVAAACAHGPKRCILELGGSDPFLVLADADLDLAAEQGAISRLFCNGESCIAAKRFIVVPEIADAFIEKLKARMTSKRMGPPLERDTDLGPMARKDLRDTLHQQVTDSVAKGAVLVCGGEIPDGPGYYYPATILDAVTPGMPAYEEELFGPVAAILRARDEAHAIELANDTPYGLGAAIFTRDTARAERIMQDEIGAGACFVNAFVRSDPRLPFGGTKGSGYGRELGPHGIRDLTHIKTVYIA